MEYKIADISLADFRNKIALYNTQITIYSISISIGSFLAAIYGMNLKNNIEYFDGGLYLVSFIILLLIVLIYHFVYNKLEIILKELSTN